MLPIKIFIPYKAKQSKTHGVSSFFYGFFEYFYVTSIVAKKKRYATVKVK